MPRTTTKSSKTSSSPTAKSKRSSGTQQKDDRTMLTELFLDELKDIYWAEKHLTEGLSKMQKAAHSEDLANAFADHLEQTHEHIERLEEVFELMEVPARAKKCEAMEGLVKEGQEVMEQLPKGTAVRDAGLIISAQQIEHYGIAAYGSLVQLAKTIGRSDVADILAQTLEEEKETDQLLTELAESGININAENEDEMEG